MKLETWMYKQVLELYPRAYREQFGQPMLETYTDSLKAAKLEGKTPSFHFNTVLDTIKSIFRVTIEVKNADPLARVTAVLGLMLLILLLVGLIQVPLVPIVWKYVSPVVVLLFVIGLTFFANCFYEMRHKWILPLMMILSALGLFIRFYFELFYPSQIFSVLQDPQLNPYANTTLLVFAYISKILSALVLVLIVGSIALEAVEKRRVLPINRFILSYIVVTFGLRVIAPQGPDFIVKILSAVYFIIWFAVIIFICLRLWQQPRAAPRVITTT
jgi:hypothetical protein